MRIFKKLGPGRIISLGFAGVILLGVFLLWLPISANEGIHVSLIDALFTSTSAVCVTGLIAVDTADTFNLFGQIVVAALIQIGGLGVTSIGVGFIILAGKKVGIKSRILVREAMNLDSLGGIVKLVKAILLMTLTFESIGAVLSFITFSKDYPFLQAVWISIFHSIAAFNNSGFDILGGLQNLIPYQNNVLLNLTTCGLIIFGGLGFLVILDIMKKRSFKKLTLHSKVVIVTSVFLLVIGTIGIKCTENITWLGAFFNSTSARTAGFSTFPLGQFSNATLFILIILMFVGASPGSTGGGIKTTTAYILFKHVVSIAKNKNCSTFKREISNDTITKANIILLLGLSVVVFVTLGITILQPEFSFIHVLTEVTSAFGTVGLSAGITTSLNVVSKLLIILTMFIGRLGPLTIASLWSFNEKSGVHYSKETITIG